MGSAFPAFSPYVQGAGAASVQTDAASQPAEGSMATPGMGEATATESPEASGAVSGTPAEGDTGTTGEATAATGTDTGIATPTTGAATPAGGATGTPEASSEEVPVIEIEPEGGATTGGDAQPGMTQKPDPATDDKAKAGTAVMPKTATGEGGDAKPGDSKTSVNEPSEVGEGNWKSEKFPGQKSEGTKPGLTDTSESTDESTTTTMPKKATTGDTGTTTTTGEQSPELAMTGIEDVNVLSFLGTMLLGLGFGAYWLRGRLENAWV